MSEIVKLKLTEITPYERNPRKNDAAVDDVAESIRQCGYKAKIIVDENNVIIAGHTRWKALQQLGYTEVEVQRETDMTEEQKRKYRLLDNKVGEKATWDFELLDWELEDLDFEGYDFGFEFDEDTFDDAEEEPHGKLSDSFIIPPFDVLNARGGDWVKRKQWWNQLIGDKAQAREGSNANMSGTEKYGKKFASDVSILDPVLSEIAVKWFCTPDGKCFDCFAGDTVFGFVSGYLGHQFTGIELREEQVEFNNTQVDGLPAKYICDDGRNVLQHVGVNTQDFLFSCPPYFDLEVYSDLENDASNQESYEDFYAILDTAFTNAAKALKNNRFAVIVVGDIRDKKTGGYYNFPSDIINTFQRNGFVLYNNMKILTPIGTAAIRAAKYMEYRKVAHVYQDVLVFYKGDQREIKKQFPQVEVSDVSEDLEL